MSLEVAVREMVVRRKAFAQYTTYSSLGLDKHREALGRAVKKVKKLTVEVEAIDNEVAQMKVQMNERKENY